MNILLYNLAILSDAQLVLIPEIILKTDFSCGGANVRKVHQPLSPKSAVPEMKVVGQLTDIVPATVLCQEEVLR